jgi:hypothetical protein
MLIPFAVPRSYGMFIRRLADPVVARIERRISLWTHLPIENQEDIQASMRSCARSHVHW